MAALSILTFVLFTGPEALAVPGDITLASTSDTGEKGTDFSGTPSLSADGSKVAFTSFAANLDPADSDMSPDVYVMDLATGNITLASTSDAGLKGNDRSRKPSLSADGSKVAFQSDATNLDPADTDTFPDIYVKDLTTGDITLASTSDAGVKGNDESEYASLSADGSKVAFHAHATNLDPADTDTNADVYVKTLTTGEITLASTSDAGLKGNGESEYPSLSADGSKVAFYSDATNLDPAYTNTNVDVYVKDLVTGDIVLASTSDAAARGNDFSFDPSLSADGSKVAFTSFATNLDLADTDTDADVYIKDLATGGITLATASDAEVKANNRSRKPSLSADGSKVAFQSDATNLDPADTDMFPDIYVKDLATGDITLANTSDAGVKANGDSFAPSVSSDGTGVAFGSLATNLDPADTDSIHDVYVKKLHDASTECTITGTKGDDRLEGTRDDDVICALAGNDLVVARGGNDIVIGGDGNDRLKGQGGSDLLQGEAGEDSLVGGRGADTFEGGLDEDQLRGVDGVSGNDSLEGGPATDRCSADEGDAIASCEEPWQGSEP